MSRDRTWLPLLTLLMCTLLILSACAPSSASGPAGQETQAATAPAGSSGQVIQFTMLSNFTPDVARGKVLQSLIDEFNQQQAGKIKIVSNPDPDWPGMQQKIKSMIAAGTPPDIFLYNYNPNDLSREQSGKLFDFGPALNADSAWKASFRPDNLAALTMNGQTVGIPSDQAPVLFYYHKDLFDQAGITSFPKTWDEFFTAADKLKASGVAPIALMTADDAWHAMNAFTYLAASYGGKDVFAPGQSLNSQPIIQAATQLQRLFGYTTPDAVGANYAVSSQNFASKRAAMVIDGPWLISSLQQGQGAGDVAVAASPTFGDNKIPAGFIVTDSMNPWAGASTPDQQRGDALVTWMKFLTSEPSVKRMTIEGEYPLAVKVTYTDQDKAKMSPQMAQVVDISGQAPVAVVEAVRNIKPAAQAALPSLLESLALNRITPEQFASQLENANK